MSSCANLTCHKMYWSTDFPWLMIFLHRNGHNLETEDNMHNHYPNTNDNPLYANDIQSTLY